MNFQHKNSSTDYLKISVADLRDLIQSISLNEDDRLAEIELILQHIEHKNQLKTGTFEVKKVSHQQAFQVPALKKQF